jgi:DNA-binding SARP family transcriptional activator
MKFCLLGPLMVRNGTAVVPLPRGKQRALLVALLLEANRAVSLDELVQTLWGDDPPRSARVTLQNYVKRLRKTLGDTEARRISTQPRGYMIRADANELDVNQFEALSGAASAAARGGSWDTAATQARAALSLWRGQPLADVESEELVRREVPRLAEMRLQALETRIEADLHLGRHADLIAELRRLADDHPLREHVHAQLMLALYRNGCQAEALAAYRHVRRMLVEELGTEPGAGLRELHHRILKADPALTVAEPRPVVPRQLPAAVPHFAGRAAELAALDGLLEQDGEKMPGTVVISAIGGTAGVGKTALAVHWAHQVADRFPDGQLHVNLRGFGPGGRPVTSGEAVRAFLDGLRVPHGQIPTDEQAQAALYRSLLAGRRMLIVLDNARDPAQVRPLLPGAPGCLVLVTSRNQLAGLAAADGAHLLTLDVLTEPEARAVLAGRLSPARVGAEQAVIAELARLCARLPLALGVTAARAAASPGLPLAALAAELRDASARLAGLDTGEVATDVRTVFSWSYRQLSDGAGRMFRLLGVHPGADITIAAAASLAGLSPGQTRHALTELAHASLVTEHTPGRYACHDLLRAYAAEQARDHESVASRRAASRRILGYYLHSAFSGSTQLAPTRIPITLAAPESSVRPETFDDPQEALAWFKAERLVLLAAVGQAADQGFDLYAWQLPWSMAMFLGWYGYWRDMRLTQESALAAARRIDDLAAQAQAHRDLSHAHLRLGEQAQAMSHSAAALQLGRQRGDLSFQARVHGDMSRMLHGDRDRDALGHAEEALTLYRAARDKTGEAKALNDVGWCHALLGNYRQTLEYCQQALVLHCRAGNTRERVGDLHSLGFAHHHLGHHTRAIGYYQQAIDCHVGVGDRHDLAQILTDLGAAYDAAAQPAGALRAWREALAIFDDLDDPRARDLRDKLAGQ